MIYKIQGSKKQEEKLQKMQEQARKDGNFIWFRRCTAILLRLLGLYQEEVAAGLGVCTRAVQKWEALLLSGGPHALIPKKSPGRPPRLTKTQKTQLREQIEQGPQKCGYKGGVWTGAMVQDHIQKNFGVFYCVKYICQLLRNIGLSHIKPKFSYCNNKKDLKKQLKWIHGLLPGVLKEIAEVHGVLLFLDESSFQLQSNLLHTWAPKGKPPTFIRNPKRGSLRVLGCIELFTGTLTYSIEKKSLKNDVFAAFLKRVAGRYAGKPVYIILDNAPYHGGKHVTKFQKSYRNVHLVNLPKRAPHLNPIEKLWKEIKRYWSHNLYFPEKGALESSMRKGFHFYQEHPEMVRSLMNKWEKMFADVQGVAQGKYDPSLIPDKLHLWLDELLQEIVDESINVP